MDSARRRLVWPAALLAAVLVAGAGWLALDRDDPREATSEPLPAASTPVPADDPELLIAVDEILRDRARAVLTGRRELFLRWVDPANAAFLAGEQQVYANLRVMRPAELSYLRHTYWPEPEVQRQHGQDAHAFLVVMRIRIAGLDASTRVTEVGYSFARRGDRYLLVDDDDIDADLRVGRHREAWDFGPVQAVRAPGVMVVVSRGEGRLGSRLVREAVAALPAVRRLTGRRLNGVLVVAINDRRIVTEEWRTAGDTFAAVAVPHYLPLTPRSRTEYRVVGSSVIVNPADRNDADRMLLAHEFTHAAWMTIRDAPAWLAEGYAMLVEMEVALEAGHEKWVDDRYDEVLIESLPELTGLPIDGLFHGDHGEDSYGISWVVVEYLADEYGLDELNAFYADHGPGQEESALLRKHFGIDTKGLVAAVKRQG